VCARAYSLLTLSHLLPSFNEKKSSQGAIAEAAACALPMLLYDYLPGQEEANLDFVRQRAMGDYQEVPISRSIFFLCLYIYIYVCAPAFDGRLWTGPALDLSQVPRYSEAAMKEKKGSDICKYKETDIDEIKKKDTGSSRTQGSRMAQR
jgi:hypothetical protein